MSLTAGTDRKKKTGPGKISKVLVGEGTGERDNSCPLGRCQRKFFDSHGAAQHAVDSHR